MSETPKRQFVHAEAGLSSTHIPADGSETPYHEQLLTKVQELFAAEPDSTKQLIGIDLASFALRTDESRLISDLRKLNMTYQVVRFGGKTGRDTGVLITRLPVPA